MLQEDDAVDRRETELAAQMERDAELETTNGIVPISIFASQKRDPLLLQQCHLWSCLYDNTEHARLRIAIQNQLLANH